MKKEYTAAELAAFLGTIEADEVCDRVRGKNYGTAVVIGDNGYLYDLGIAINGEFKDIRHDGVKTGRKQYDAEFIKERLEMVGEGATLYVSNAELWHNGKVKTTATLKIRKRGNVWKNKGVTTF